MRKLFLSIISLLIVLALPWIIISTNVSDRVYRDVEAIPARDVGLLLGTTPSVDGRRNLFYTTRIEAAKTLHEKGKIRHVLVSGDNSTAAYNEPEAMRKSLIAAGIPEGAITLDYAGFRTLDSVVRAREIFGQGSGFTIISQPFHVERALYLARSRDIDAIGYGAANVAFSIAPRVYIREIGARVIALYDALFGTDPVVLGEREVIDLGK